MVYCGVIGKKTCRTAGTHELSGTVLFILTRRLLNKIKTAIKLEAGSLPGAQERFSLLNNTCFRVHCKSSVTSVREMTTTAVGLIIRFKDISLCGYFKL